MQIPSGFVIPRNTWTDRGILLSKMKFTRGTDMQKYEEGEEYVGMPRG